MDRWSRLRWMLATTDATLYATPRYRWSMSVFFVCILCICPLHKSLIPKKNVSSCGLLLCFPARRNLNKSSDHLWRELLWFVCVLFRNKKNKEYRIYYSSIEYVTRLCIAVVRVSGRQPSTHARTQYTRATVPCPAYTDAMRMMGLHIVYDYVDCVHFFSAALDHQQQKAATRKWKPDCSASTKSAWRLSSCDSKDAFFSASRPQHAREDALEEKRAPNHLTVKDMQQQAGCTGATGLCIALHFHGERRPGPPDN